MRSKDGKDRVCISYRPTEREATAKRQSEGDILRNAWYWRRAQSDLPPGCLWQLWRSHSARMAMFFADVPPYLTDPPWSHLCCLASSLSSITPLFWITVSLLPWLIPPLSCCFCFPLSLQMLSSKELTSPHVLIHDLAPSHSTFHS